MSQPIACYQLPPFAMKNWISIRSAFNQSTPLPLVQSWRATPEKNFRSATVFTGWRERHFYVFAQLDDTDIFTRATACHQRMWELGDTFEIFLRPTNQNAYVEFHLTPNNLTLALQFSSAATRLYGKVEDFLVKKPLFQSKTVMGQGCWMVLAKIPFRSVWKKKTSPLGSEWLFSFSRYDYTRGRAKPVLSSTSAHAVLGFHRQQEWGKLQLKP